MLLYHSPAFFCTIMANFGANGAMLHVLMLIAFSSACVTDIRTYFTYFLVKLASPGKHFCCHCTYVGTFIIELYATGEHMDITFLQTCIGTMDALCCTFLTCIDTILKIFMTHSCNDIGYKMLTNRTLNC